MGRRRKAPRKQTWVAIFAEAELKILVDKLKAMPEVSATPSDVLGALVMAARDIPLPVLRELLALYEVQDEAEVAKLPP